MTRIKSTYKPSIIYDVGNSQYAESMNELSQHLQGCAVAGCRCASGLAFQCPMNQLSHRSEHAPPDAESVALARDGSLWMLDKYGFVWRAPKDGQGSYALEKEPLTQLGPGRPLGFDFDEQENLIVCNSGSVRPPAYVTAGLGTLVTEGTIFLKRSR